MFAIAFVLLVISVTAVLIEKNTPIRFGEWANAVFGAMLIFGYIMLVVALATILWKNLP